MRTSSTTLVALALLVVGATLAPSPRAFAEPPFRGAGHAAVLHQPPSRPSVSLFARAEQKVGEARRALRSALDRVPLLTVVPVDAPPSSEFGVRRDPINRRRRMHTGIDFAADRGDTVLSAGAGRVAIARRKSGYGRIVVIDHGLGLRTRYAHLQSIDVRRGDIVEAGQEIGAVGATGRATGPHLHFEVRRDGDAIDPREVMQIPTRHEWAMSHSLRDPSLQL